MKLLIDKGVFGINLGVFPKILGKNPPNQALEILKVWGSMWSLRIFV